MGISRVGQRRMTAGSDRSANDQVVNLADVMNRLGGDQQLFVELAKLYLEDEPQLVETVRRSIEAAHWEEAHRLVHGAKGLAANFGAPAATSIGQRLENALAQRDLPAVDDLFPQFVEKLEDVSVALQAALSTLPDRSATRTAS